MQFSILAVAAMAATVLAGGVPQRTSFGVEQNKSQCGSGDVICCNPIDDEPVKGLLLNGLLKNGLVNLFGVQNSACVKPSLIDSINILAFVEKDEENTYCKHETYCCPVGEDCYNSETGKKVGRIE